MPVDMPLLTDDQAQSLSTLFSRRSLLGASIAAGGLLATPLGAFAQAASAPGEAEITVDQARTAPIPIAIPSFGPGLGEQITGVVSADLEATGLFTILPVPAAPRISPR